MRAQADGSESAVVGRLGVALFLVILFALPFCAGPQVQRWLGGPTRGPVAPPAIAAEITEVSFRPIGSNPDRPRYEVTVYLANWTRHPSDRFHLDVRLAQAGRLVGRDLVRLPPLPPERLTVRRIELAVPRADAPDQAWAALVDRKSGAFTASQ